MDYYIGQDFFDEYPPEAAEWCNENDAHITALLDGRYVIEKNESIDVSAIVKQSQISRRDRLLRDSDFLMLSDYPIDKIGREVVKKYRQRLRDITKDPQFPDVSFPEIPDISKYKL